MNDRYSQTLWMAGDDPIKVEALNKLPVIEYFALLDKRLADAKAAMNRMKK